MDGKQAVNILGANRTRQETTNMAKALRMCSWLNTDEENLRLEASRWALMNWSAYTEECNRARDEMSKRGRRRRK